MGKLTKFIPWKLTQSKWIALGFTVVILLSSDGSAENEFVWKLPSWAPLPIVPANNPMSEDKVELGRRLFYEKKLSINKTMSCGTCHLQEKAFSDGRRTALGATGESHTLNSPTIINVAYSPILTWADPSSRLLEEHPLKPLFNINPIEMGMSGQEKRIIETLESDPDYSSRFRDSFPQSQIKVSIRNITKAIAAFQRTLISFSSPYDEYRYNQNKSAISESAKKGEKLFFSERLNCFQCHQAPFFTDSYTYRGLPFEEIAFHNTGLYNLFGKGGYPFPNTGLHRHTGKPEDMGRFRTPTLRNIALTAPYMHDGSINSLRAVLEFYSRGGRNVKSGPLSGDGAKNIFKSSFVKGFTLSDVEMTDVISFLKSLTDITFIKNRNYGRPKEFSATP